MRAFSSTQEDFQNYLLKGDLSLFPHIADPITGSKEARLQIYYTAYRLRLQEALATLYPRLHQYMGDEDFYALCMDYIRVYPSSFRSIRWFGAELTRFLQTCDRTLDRPYLAELADFEWTSSLVFDAEEGPSLMPDDLSIIPPEAWGDLYFNAHPSLYRVHTHWNVIPLLAHLNDQSTLSDLVLSPQSTTWVLWRKDLINYHISLSHMEAEALDVLLTQETFGMFCQKLCQWLPEKEASLQAASFLKNWILKGFFRSFSLK